MSTNMNKSFCVPRINKRYTDEIIKYLFWKFCVGQVDRVDFELIIDEETGVEDSNFQKACVYMSSEFNVEQLYYNEKERSYILYPYRIPHKKYINNINTNTDERENDNDCFLLYNNPSPIPYTNTTMNVHQLHHKNLLLEQKIKELEKQIATLSN